MSVHDAISDFITAMEAAGVKPAEPIAQRLGSGDLIRFKCEGDKGRKNGWAILYLDARPAGAFGNYKQNTGTLKWKANSDAPALSTEERQALQREWSEARERREAERRNSQDEARRDAAELWQRAKPASPDHPYITRKGIAAGILRQDGQTLLVPMCDHEGTLWNLQRIRPDGTKRFLGGGLIDNLFAIIGTIDHETREAIFVEGYATGDTVHRATSLPVIVAFNTSNLPKVARLWADERPDIDYTVFADDDEQTAREYVAQGKEYKNPGISTAEAVANAIGANIAYPLGKPAGEAA